MKTKLFSLFLSALITIAFISCKEKKDEPLNGNPDTTEIDDFVKSLNVPVQDAPTPSETKETEISETEICTVTEKTVSEEYDESVVLDPTSDVIYPGALIDGNSITTGEYKPLLGCKRAPLTISTDFANTSTSSSAVVENPSLSTIRDGIKKCIANADITGSTVAKLSWEITEVHSEEQVQVAIGATATIGKKASISNQFNWNDNSKQSRFLIKFVQTYYTIDIDFPVTPSAWFENTTMAEFKKMMGDNPTVPCFVSSVTYGRRAYICIESSESSKEVSDALNASFQAGAVSADISTNIKNNKTLSEARFSGVIIGGSASDASKAINNQQAVLEFITNGGNFSKESPAAMVSYRLRKMSDNTVFKAVSAGTYYLRDCESRFGELQLKPQKITCVSEHATIKGTLSASTMQDNSSSDNQIFYNNSNELSAGGSYTFPQANQNLSFKIDVVEDVLIWLHFDLKSGNENNQRFYVQWDGKNIHSLESGKNFSANGTSVVIPYSQLIKLANNQSNEISHFVMSTNNGYAVKLANGRGESVSFYFNVDK
ncbi:MAG: thiol-activated cytolysin family protein [Paludibacteraceae bacterium]|nr:thiol-activated cytolysin family protein [Paludibacteraceae bacterium]